MKTTAGIWNLYTLNNGGAFMAPEPDDDDDETWVLFNAIITVLNEPGSRRHCCLSDDVQSSRLSYGVLCHDGPLLPAAGLRPAASGMQRHYAHHRLNGGRTMQQLSFSARRNDARASAALILRALKTLDRHLHEPGVAFTSTRAAREWLILNMAGLWEREEFRRPYRNNQNQLLPVKPSSPAPSTARKVHPPEVIKRALYHNAAAVVLAHNHPSGEVTPSKADRLITERLVQALGLVDIRVPDQSHSRWTRFSSLPNMVCFNPSQPHHTCFHFYLLSSEVSHYENYHPW